MSVYHGIFVLIFSKEFSVEHCAEYRDPYALNHRYELVLANMDWQSAADYCHSKRKASLPMIKSAHDQLGLSNFLSQMDSGMSLCLSVTSLVLLVGHFVTHSLTVARTRLWLVVTRKLSYRKDDRAMRLICGRPKKISGVPNYAHCYFVRNL